MLSDGEKRDRMVCVDEYAAHEGPLLQECPICGSGQGISCTILTAPQPGDVRGLSVVRQQVREFHQSRIREAV